MPRITPEEFCQSIDEINQQGRRPGICVELEPEVLDRLVARAEEKGVELDLPVDPGTLAAYLITRGLEPGVWLAPEALLNHERVPCRPLVPGPPSITPRRLTNAEKAHLRMTAVPNPELEARRVQPTASFVTLSTPI